MRYAQDALAFSFAKKRVIIPQNNRQYKTNPIVIIEKKIFNSSIFKINCVANPYIAPDITPMREVRLNYLSLDSYKPRFFDLTFRIFYVSM